MFSPLKFVAAAVAIVALALPGAAQAVPITSALTNGYLTFTLDTSFANPCTSAATTGNTATSCANINWVASGNGFTLQNSNVANPLEFAATAGFTSNADITLHFVVTSSIPNYLSGVNVSADLYGDFSSVTDTVVGTSGAAASAASGLNSRSVVTAAKAFAPATTVQAMVDIKASSTTGNGTVYTVSQTFAVPEPATMALLVTGLVSAGLVRRRKAQTQA